MTDTSSAPGTSGTPTVVLVHGAFADASGWAGVIERLMAAGRSGARGRQPLARHQRRLGLCRQRDPPDSGAGPGRRPLLRRRGDHQRRLQADKSSGWSTSPRSRPTRARACSSRGRSRDSILPAALRQTDYPVGSGADVTGELSIDVALFREAFAADLPEAQSDVMARSQRPVAVAAFGEKTGAPAWKKLPSWAVVAPGTRRPGDVVLSMARRAGAEVIVVDASHVPMMSQPGVVTGVILTAVKAVA